MNRIHVLRGLFYPDLYTYKLRDSEYVPGVWKNTTMLVLLSGLIFGISAYFGIGSEYLSKNLTAVSRENYELHKLLFMIGQLIWGLFYGLAMIFIPALFFWTFSDIELKKFVTVQLYVMPVLLLEKVINIPLATGLGLIKTSSPFSLGVIAQYITNNDFIIYFLAAITLFKVWVIFIEYKYIKMLTGKRPGIVLLLVIGINLIFWLFSALFSFIQFEKIL
ncbi:hypothetical protein M3172_14700 [Mesobacillus subterraneus]|uniref:hypothetical protein n=1 Tax=Mesobacillus subterraneus TaxID=285983 RepID=UPI002041EE93|nr:hypothetical protein [Mesobacillus subterraneus]MCM3574443.1 hypothetical protein [Mesobacillus subterraneus]